MSRLDFSLLSVTHILSLYACTRCGECLDACPVLLATGRDYSTALDKIELWRATLHRQSSLLRRLVGSDRVTDFRALADAAYDCTLCGRCHAVCPVYIQTHDLWIAQRRQLAQAHMAPLAISLLAERLRESGNIVGRPAEERTAWLNNMTMLPQVEGQPEVILYTGCLSSLYPQAFGLSQSLLSLLTLAGIPVALLGEKEVCCGYPLYASGLEAEAIALARHNLLVMKATGARTVVTPCPSCYHTLSECYPRWLGSEMDLRVMHGTEYLDQVVASIQPHLGPVPMRVTYHDPCDLGRLSGIYEIPRRLLQLIPGLELIEMRENREQALCCGGGGDVEMVNEGLSHAIADQRFAQALETGAEAIVTACPQCKRSLSAAARRARRRMRTYDVAELLAASVEHH